MNKLSTNSFRLRCGSRFRRGAEYRGGAFVVLHGTRNKTGYDLVFVPFDHKGKSGDPKAFADGFAAFDRMKT